MGATQAQKQKNRDRLLRHASVSARKEGLGSLGARKLMNELNLTHGGFYGHFSSLDDLIGLTVRQALDDGAGEFTEFLQLNGHSDYESLVRSYLSTAHRDKHSDGCGFAALVGDIARSDIRLKSIFTDRLKQTLGDLANVRRDIRHDESLCVFSAMIGALLLARAVSDDSLSRRILSSVSKDLASRSHLNRRKKGTKRR